MHERVPTNNDKRLVDPVYFEMFRLKLMGLTYENIAARTGYSASRVEHIFCKGGPLYDYWQKWKQENYELSVEDSMTMMFGHTPQIVRTMIVSAEKPHSMVGLMAGTKILEYTLGKPEEKIKIKGTMVFATVAELIDAVTKNDGPGNAQTGNSDPVATATEQVHSG